MNQRSASDALRGDSLSSLSESAPVADPHAHRLYKQQPANAGPMTRTNWVVVRRYGFNMELQGREEFTHPNFARAVELAGEYVKRMAQIHNLAFSHFTIEIIASKE